MFHPNIYNDGKICLDSITPIIQYCKTNGAQSTTSGPSWPQYALFSQIQTPTHPQIEMQLSFITWIKYNMKEESNKLWIWASCDFTIPLMPHPKIETLINKSNINFLLLLFNFAHSSDVWIKLWTDYLRQCSWTWYWDISFNHARRPILLLFFNIQIIF